MSASMSTPMPSPMPHTLKLPAGLHVMERGWLSSNNILLVDAQQSVLIDSGYIAHAPQTLSLLQNLLPHRGLDRLINTHLHSDHCGGNALLQATYGCQTLVPAAELAAVQSWDQARLSFADTGQRCEQFSADLAYQAGDSMQMAGLSWQVLAAPGHDPHSLIFYAPAEGLLISADALWGNGFGAIFGELQGTGGFAEQAAVLQLISELDVRLVIPGHGAPFTDVAAALTRARDKLAYLATEPKRNTRQIIRVLIAFLLLDERAISETALLQRYANSSIMQAASEQLNEPLAVLLKTATCELARLGVLEYGDGWLRQRAQ